jgi:ATP-binding cassette, subfamily B, heavy metal transporter
LAGLVVQKKNINVGFLAKKLFKHVKLQQMHTARPILLKLGLCMILSKMLLVGLPAIFGIFLDQLNTFTDESSLKMPILLIALYGSLMFISKVFTNIQEIYFSKFSERLTRNISSSVFNHLHTLTHDFYIKSRPGALAQSTRLGIRSINTILSSFVFSLVPSSIEFLFISSVFLYMFSFKYLIILIIGVIFYSFISFHLTKLRLATVKNLNDHEVDASAFFSESINNFETIRLFIKKDKIINDYNNSLEKIEISSVKSVRDLCGLKMLQELFMTSIFVAFLAIVLIDFSKKYISIGEVVMIMTWLMQLLLPVEALILEQDLVQKSLVDADGLFEILNITPQNPDKIGAKSMQIHRGEIVFKNISFGYENEKNIFENLSFSIDGRSMVGFIGTSGTGKTTLLKLLSRYYESYAGEILIDGQNIRNVTRESLQKQISIVPQDIVLFNESIKFNINCLQFNEIDMERIVEVAKMAQIHEKILSMPDQYNTIVGERGLRLSAGEKQRIGLARALLKKPSILILDEATSFLDSRTENEFYRVLQELKKQCTIINITHRLSLISCMDVIYLFDKGVLVSVGPPTFYDQGCICINNSLKELMK